MNTIVIPGQCTASELVQPIFTADEQSCSGNFPRIHGASKPLMVDPEARI
jgi:hypothetical protein